MSLSETLQRIWREEVRKDYLSGIISSERELQACLYFHLRHAMTAGTARWRIFVEPTVNSVAGAKLHRRPDLVVAQRDASGSLDVLAIIELKLDRGGYIKFESEFERIEALKSHSAISIKNQRPDREREHDILHLGEHTKFFLGFVGSDDAAALWPEEVRQRNANFLLHSADVAQNTTLLLGRAASDGRVKFFCETVG